MTIGILRATVTLGSLWTAVAEVAGRNLDDIGRRRNIQLRDLRCIAQHNSVPMGTAIGLAVFKANGSFLPNALAVPFCCFCKDVHLFLPSPGQAFSGGVGGRRHYSCGLAAKDWWLCTGNAIRCTRRQLKH